MTQEYSDIKPNRGILKIYCCGPTVYDDMHIGHARQAIVMHAFTHYLRETGFDFKYVSNYTDIDDKIIARAEREETAPKHISEKYIERYEEDLRSLNIAIPETVKVTDNIANIIEFINDLIDLDHAYQKDGNVLFKIMSFDKYGDLSRVPVETICDAEDFALWKKGDIGWDSPWGKGRPGWHIECSSIVRSRFAGTIDIHAGGLDLIFPHHENEKAQTEAIGLPLAKTWMHIGLVQKDGKKISKSEGNTIFVRDLLQNYSPRAIRHYILSSHYRSPIEFDTKYLEDSEKAMDTVEEFLIRAHQYEEKTCLTFDDLENDFNTAAALGNMFKLINKANTMLGKGETSFAGQAAYYIRQLLSRLGFAYIEVRKNHLVDLIVDIRKDIRDKGDWEKSDLIRDKLKDIGVELKDTKNGTTYRIKNDDFDY